MSASGRNYHEVFTVLDIPWVLRKANEPEVLILARRLTHWMTKVMWDTTMLTKQDKYALLCRLQRMGQALQQALLIMSRFKKTCPK